MVTAGHCNQIGNFVRWYSGYYDSATQTLNKFLYEGDAFISVFANGYPDVMLISQMTLGTFGSSDHYGEPTWHEHYPLLGQASVKNGDKVCVDGEPSGIIKCSATVFNTGVYITVTDQLGPVSDTQTVGPEDEAISATPFCIPGDSGGPVSLDSKNQMTAVGTIEGAFTNPVSAGQARRLTVEWTTDL